VPLKGKEATADRLFGDATRRRTNDSR